MLSQIALNVEVKPDLTLGIPSLESSNVSARSCVQNTIKAFKMRGKTYLTEWTNVRERERICFYLTTFYLRLYGVRHMVKDHSDSEKGNPLPPHRLLLSINSKGSFICTIPQTG